MEDEQIQSILLTIWCIVGPNASSAAIEVGLMQAILGVKIGLHVDDNSEPSIEIEAGLIYEPFAKHLLMKIMSA